jgi:hypothetical protein
VKQDVKETKDFKKEQLDLRFWYSIGILVAFLGTIVFLVNSQDAYVERERDKTLEAQRLERERKGKSPFDDA